MNKMIDIQKFFKDDNINKLNTIKEYLTDDEIQRLKEATTPAKVNEIINLKITELVGAAPETLDTLKELADALGNDPNFATTLAGQLAEKATKEDITTVTEKIDGINDRLDSVNTLASIVEW